MTLTPSRVNQGLPTSNANAWPVSVQAIGAGLALPIVGSVLAPQTGAWTSATALNTAVTVSGCGPYGAANVAINVPSTVTAGVITLEVSHDGTTYYPAGSVRIDNSYAENTISLAYAPGINGNRNFLVSLDAFTNIRARLSTVITGTGTVNVAIVVGQQGVEPFVAQRSRKVATYRAVFRTTTRPYYLSKVFTANTRVQFATIHHAATAVRTVRLRRVLVGLRANTVAVDLNMDLVRITSAPATGNPAITSSRADSSDAVAEATCLALPTTAGTEEAQPFSTLFSSPGVTGAGSTANPVPGTPWIDLLATGSWTGDDESKVPAIRAGVLEGWAVTIDANAATTLTAQVVVEFTEEAP